MLITSASNPLIKRIRELRAHRKARCEHGEFFVEGVQAISEAYRNGWSIRRLIYCVSFVASPWARETLDASDPATRVEVDASLLRRLSERDEPPELMAIVARRDYDIRRIPLTPNPLIIALDRIRNAGNLGSVIRSADALGATGVFVIEPSVDITDPKTVRATMGSLFSIPTVSLSDAGVLRDWIRTTVRALKDLRVAAAVPHDATPLYACDFTAPTVIVIGNEQEGVADDVLSLCAERVSIPMTRSVDSLNGAVAASICLYEASRQRRLELTPLNGRNGHPCST